MRTLEYAHNQQKCFEYQFALRKQRIFSRFYM